MKRVRVKNTEESLLLTGMIISSRVLRDIQSVFDLKLLQSSYSKRVARWALDYFKEHQKAPGVHIEDIFKQWMEKGGEAQEDEGQMISRLLQRISDEYDRAADFNEQYVLNVAEKYFQRLDIERLAEDLQSVEEAEAIQILHDWKPKQIPSHAGIDMVRDKKAIRRAFEADEKPLMLLPGAMGDLLNGDLCRGSFVAFMGREKIGKTWVLSEMAFQGAMNRLQVAFFQAGDMSEEQQLRRGAIRMAGKSHKKKYCGEILMPVYDCLHNQKDSCEIGDRENDMPLNAPIEKWEDLVSDWFYATENKVAFWEENYDAGYEPCDYCRRRDPRNYQGAVWYKKHDTGPPLTWREGIKAAEKFAKRLKGKKLMLASYSNNTLSPSMIMAQLDSWANYQDFIPDVIVIDYADILAPDDTRQDFRHQQNQTWKTLRRISQDYSCLVVTATQADAAAYNQDTLDMSNFSEDKRKYAHVTSMYSLNQKYQEKIAGIMRVAAMIARDEDFDTQRQAKVLQCLQRGQPMIGSFF